MHSSSLHPLHSLTHHSPAPPNPIHHRQSLKPVSKLNELDPSMTMMTKATHAILPHETALPTKPPTIKTICHKFLPKPQHPNQTLAMFKTCQLGQNKMITSNTPNLPPTLSSPHNLATKSIFSTPPLSPLSCNLIQRLQQQLTITKALINCLSNMIPTKATNKPSSKNLFDLITDLPPINPMALLQSVYTSNFDYAQLYLQVLHTCDQYWSQPKSLDCLKTCSTHHSLSILLWSILQSTLHMQKFC